MPHRRRASYRRVTDLFKEGYRPTQTHTRHAQSHADPKRTRQARPELQTDTVRPANEALRTHEPTRQLKHATSPPPPRHASADAPSVPLTADPSLPDISAETSGRSWRPGQLGVKQAQAEVAWARVGRSRTQALSLTHPFTRPDERGRGEAAPSAHSGLTDR